jgi:hypothetical protein
VKKVEEKLKAIAFPMPKVGRLSSFCFAFVLHFACSGMVKFSWRLILLFDAATCAIPGVKLPSQAELNFLASVLPPFSDEMKEFMRVYLTGTFA